MKKYRLFFDVVGNFCLYERISESSNLYEIIESSNSGNIKSQISLNETYDTTYSFQSDCLEDVLEHCFYLKL